MSKRACLSLAVSLFVLQIVAIGCSSDNGDVDGGVYELDAVAEADGTAGADAADGAVGVDAGEDAPAPGDAAMPQPGKITVSATGITGHQNDGFLLLISVSPAGQPQTTLGTSCTMLTSDPFSLPAGSIIQGLEPQDDNPCQPSGGDKQFDPGDYDVVFAVIKGGEQVPERSAKVTATVDGDITVSAPDYTDWRGTDPNAQPGTITVNASDITGHPNDGYILMIMATHPNAPNALLGSTCQVITSDPFSLPADATVLQGWQQGDGSPCDASGGDMQFDGGDYDVTFSVIKGGEQVPENSTTVPAVVDGDIIVTAPDYTAW